MFLFMTRSAWCHQPDNDIYWRYLIVFANRSVADEWWRAVSTSSNNYVACHIKRVTPQLYTHEPAAANVAATITTAGVATQFLGRVIFTLLPDRDGRAINVIPVQNITDHISGNWSVRVLCQRFPRVDETLVGRR